MEKSYNIIIILIAWNKNSNNNIENQDFKEKGEGGRYIIHIHKKIHLM
jgi:hypothetical protein